MWLVLGVGCVVSCEFRPLHCRDLGPTDRFLVQQTTPLRPFQSLQRWLSEYPSAPVIWNVLLKRNNPVGKRRVAVIGGAGGIGFHFAEFLLLHQQQEPPPTIDATPAADVDPQASWRQSWVVDATLQNWRGW